jgi:hypothetical protein
MANWINYSIADPINSGANQCTCNDSSGHADVNGAGKAAHRSGDEHDAGDAEGFETNQNG